MQSVLQTLGLNQYSCTSFSVPAFSIECLKNPSFHGDPAPGQPGFLAKKKKKKKAAGRERAQGMAKLWLQKENGGYKSLSFFTQDAGMEAELWALGCERLLKGGWVQAALLILSCAPLVFFWGGGLCFLAGGFAKWVVEAGGRSWCLVAEKRSDVMLKRRWVWVCFRGMVEPGIPRPLRSTPYPPPPISRN